METRPVSARVRPRRGATLRALVDTTIYPGFARAPLAIFREDGAIHARGEYSGPPLRAFNDRYGPGRVPKFELIIGDDAALEDILAVEAKLPRHVLNAPIVPRRRQSRARLSLSKRTRVNETSNDDDVDNDYSDDEDNDSDFAEERRIKHVTTSRASKVPRTKLSGLSLQSRNRPTTTASNKTSKKATSIVKEIKGRFDEAIAFSALDKVETARLDRPVTSTQDFTLPVYTEMEALHNSDETDESYERKRSEVLARIDASRDTVSIRKF